MSDRELLDSFDQLFLGSNKRTLQLARLGANRGGVIVAETPTPVANEVYISLGANGEQGASTATDPLGIDRTAIGQQLWVRRELNKWVIYRAEVLAAGGGGGGGATTLDALTDVTTTGKVDGSILQWDATIGQWIPYSPSGGTGLPHALSDADLDALHYGDLHDDQAPQFLMRDGSRPLVGDLDVATGVSIDGVDLDQHEADPDAHHDHATAGNGGIRVSASPTQVITLKVTDVSPALLVESDGLRVLDYHGLQRDSNGLRVVARSGMTAIKVDASGIYLDDSVAGPGLTIHPTTKVLSVKAGEGLEIDPVAANDEVQVNKAHNFIWTGTHRFDALTTLNNNLHLMGVPRTVTSDSTLNLTPSGDLFLAPIANVPLTRQIRVRNLIPINSENFQDLPTNIDGLHFWQPTDGVNQWQLNINAIKADQLFVRVFTVDETRLARGQEYWSKSFGIVETSFNLPGDELTVDVWFEDVPDLPINAPLFDAGDWLQIRTIDIAAGYPAITVWFTVVDADATGTNDWILREDAVAPTVTSNGHGPRQKWRLKRENGGATGLLIRKGVVVLDAGTTGTAWIHLNALTGTLGSSGPYIQMGIMDSIAASDVPVHKNRIRIGNLKDVAGFVSTVYGMAAGNDLSMDPDDGLFTGFTIEDVGGLRLYNTDIQLYEGAIKILTLDKVKGISLVQDTAPNDDSQSAITWWDSVHAPLAVKAHITSWRDINTDSGLHIEAQTLVAGRRSVLFLQASSQGGFADISLVSPASGGTSIQVNADFVTLVDKVFVGTGGAIPGVTPPTSTLHVWDNSSAIDQAIGLLIQNSSTGDATARFYVSAAPSQYYTIGIDNSDGNKFKISIGPKLGDSSGAVDFFIYDPATNLVTLSGLTGGGGGGGTPTVLSGDGIAVSGGGPYTVAVNSSVARDDWRVDAGAGLQGGGALSSAHIELEVRPGPGIGFLSNTLIVALANPSGLNTAAGLQLDASVAGDGLEWVGLTRVMQASLGNGLVFTGTNPARDITIKLRTLSPGSGLGVTTDGLFIQRRNSSHIDSGIMMGTVDGIYLADTVAGDGLEWTTSSERIMQVSLGVGLEFTGTTPARDVQINLAALGSGMLVDANGLRLNPLVAGAGLEYIYLTGTGVLRILAGLGITVGNNDVAIDLGTNPGLSTSSGLYVLLPASGSGLVRDSTGLHLNSTVAGDGLIYDTATGEINVVPLNASLIVRASDMYVNLAHDWLWTGDHTFNTGAIRFNTTPTINANLHFLSARTITSTGNLTIDPTGNLTFTPSGELVLNPAGTVTLFTAKTFATSSHTDTPTAITGMWVYDRGANEYHMNITSLKMDELHTRVFVADEVRVDRGEEYWSKSFGIVEEEFTLPNVGTTRDVWFENSPALSEIAPNLFSVGDWLLMRTVDTATGMLIRKIWFTVISLVTAGTAANKRQCWRLEKMTGGAGTTGRVRKGTFMLDAGQTGQGWVHLLAYKEMGGPYIQVGDFSSISGGTTPQFTNRVRMGNLNGVAGITGTFWGFAAGNDLSQSPLSGNFSGFTVGKGIGSPGTNYDGLRLYNTDINMYEGGEKNVTLTQASGLRMQLIQEEDAFVSPRVSWLPDLDIVIDYSDRPIGITMKGIRYTGGTSTALEIDAISPAGQDSYYRVTAQESVTNNASSMGMAAGSSGNNYIYLTINGSGTALDTPSFRFSESNSFTNGGLSLTQQGTGDAIVQFLIYPNLGVISQQYVVGIDNSDSDKFKMAAGANVGTTPFFVYDPVVDGVGIGRTPLAGTKLHVNGSTMTPTVQGTTANNGNIVIEGTSSAVKTTSYVLLQPTGGFVGIGIDTPIVQLHVAVDSASSGAALMAQTNGGGAAVASSLILYTSNGTQAVPTATLSGDLIGQVAFQGWDTARSTGASIRAYASANWGTAADVSDDPTNLTFWTVPDGESVQEERFTILSNGNIGVNQPAPAFKLDVTGTLNATGAVTFGSSLAITGALSGVTTLTVGTLLQAPFIQGTTAANGNIEIQGTSSATKTTSLILLQPDNSGSVTIGSRIQLGLLSSVRDQGSATNYVISYGTGFISQFVLYSPRGTEAVPTPNMAGDVLGNFTFMGYGSARQTGAMIRGVAYADWGAGNVPGQLRFLTVSGGGVTIVDRMVIDYHGVGVGTLTPGVDVVGPVGTGYDIPTTNDLIQVDGTTARLMARGSSSGVLDLIHHTGPATNAKWMQYLCFGGVAKFRSMSDVGAVQVDNILVMDNLTGAVGIGTATPQPAAEPYSRLFVTASDATANQITLENSGAGQAAFVLKKVGGTASRWSMYIGSGTGTSLNFYHATPGNAMILTTAGQLQVSSLVTTGLVDVGGAITGTSIASTGAITGVTLTTPNLYGSSAANGDLTIEGTSSATKTSSYILLQPTGGRTGIGTTVPGAILSVEDAVGTDTALNSLWLTSKGNAPTMHLRRANTSGGIVSGDVIGQIAASGRYDGTSFSQAARGLIRFVAKANWTDVSQDTSILFLTTSGTNPVTAAVFEILPNGTFLSTGTYGNATPLASPSHVVSINSLGVFSSRDTWATAVTHSQSRPMWTDPDGVIGHYAVHGKISTGGVPLLVNTNHEYGTTTSARRFKEQIEDMSQEVAERIIAGLRPITYVGKDDKAKLKQFGFIAEEVHELGAKELVAYEDGDPFSLYYERFIVPLIMVVQRQEKRIQVLEFQNRRLM